MITLREQVARVIDRDAFTEGPWMWWERQQAGLTKADAIIALLIPPGYVVVPVEPTVAMIIAGATALKAGYGATPIYRAMGAALQPDRTPVDDPCRRLVRISGRDQRCDQPTPKEPE